MTTLNVIKPSVNNMCVRVLLRAAGIEAVENDVYGKTREADYLAKCPAHLSPLLEADGLTGGVLWESPAIMQYICNRDGLDEFYPSEAAARAKIDSALSYHTGALYPLLARATYPGLGFPLYAGEVGASEAGEAEKAAAQAASLAAMAEALEVYRAYYIADGPFIGGAAPSIADIRLASSLEFLDILDGALPDWAGAYKDRVEAALGQAYTEPAADVRGYIAYVKSNQG